MKIKNKENEKIIKVIIGECRNNQWSFKKLCMYKIHNALTSRRLLALSISVQLEGNVVSGSDPMGAYEFGLVIVLWVAWRGCRM